MKRTGSLSAGLLVACMVVGSVGVQAAGRKVPDYGAMQEAYHDGALTAKEYAEIAVTAMTQRDLLDDTWLTERRDRNTCLTMIVKELREIAEQDPEINRLFDGLRARQDMQDTVQSPEGLFSVHYDTTGYHAVHEPDVDVDPADGVPDFVNRCAEALDYAWHVEVDSLGFDPPSSDCGLGGSDNYDVYMYDNGWWGFSFWEESAPDYPERPRARYSHFYVNPTFNFPEMQHDSCRIPALRVTTAHELHHAIQFIYDWGEWGSLMEQTSMWMENIVWDETYCCAAYWVLMHEFLHNPHKWLYFSQLGNRFHYGACMWPFYLEHNFGRDVMRQVWQECIPIGTGGNVAYEIVLQNHGTNHAQEIPEFRVWNYFTGERDDGNHYEEGGYWPGDTLLIMVEHTDFPVISAMPVAGQEPQGYACNYIEFPELSGVDHLRVSFSDENVAVRDWAVSFVLWDPGSSGYVSMPIENEAGEVVVYPGETDTVVMIPTMLTSTFGGPQDYSYSVYANECLLSGEFVAGELVLTWVPRDGAAAYWVYGADNEAHFEPGLLSPYSHRLAVLPASTTTWSGANGIGDPDHNWTYLVVAVDALDQELMRSNRVGEHDFSTGN